MKALRLGIGMALALSVFAQAEQLAKDCKGVGIGKYCGMKHQH